MYYNFVRNKLTVIVSMNQNTTNKSSTKLYVVGANINGKIYCGRYLLYYT